MSHAQSDADSEGLDCLMERKKVRVWGSRGVAMDGTAGTSNLTGTRQLPGIAEVKVQRGKKTQQTAGTSLHEF